MCVCVYILQHSVYTSILKNLVSVFIHPTNSRLCFFQSDEISFVLTSYFSVGTNSVTEENTREITQMLFFSNERERKYIETIVIDNVEIKPKEFNANKQIEVVKKNRNAAT